MILKAPYTLLDTLDGGGLGLLLRCKDANGTLFVAKFPKDHTPESQQLLLDEERRFVRHQGDHVVRYYGRVVLSDGRTGFAMEEMQGSLAALVRRTGALPVLEALRYFKCVALGIQEVHASARGAYHGDLKLANALYRGPIAKLADFGLARGGLGQTQLLGWHTGGTPGYFPPEGYASPTGDVYSAGVMLWALLAGSEPHPRSGPHFPVQCAPELAALLNGMLSQDWRQRPTMLQVVERLSRIQSAYEPQPSSSSNWLAGAAFLGLVVLGITLFSKH